MNQKLKIHKIRRISAYFGQSITMCGRRLSNANYLLTKDDSIVTCETCKKSTKEEVNNVR